MPYKQNEITLPVHAGCNQSSLKLSVIKIKSTNFTDYKLHGSWAKKAPTETVQKVHYSILYIGSNNRLEKKHTGKNMMKSTPLKTTTQSKSVTSVAS